MNINKKNNRKKLKFIIVFCEALMIVTLLGGVLMYLYATNRGKETQAELAHPIESEQKAENNELGIVVGEPIAKQENTPVESESEEAPGEELWEMPENTSETYAQGVKYFEPQTEGEVVLAFAGDILFDDKYSIMANMKQRDNVIADTFSADLLKEMVGADIFMLNNEFTYTLRGEPTPEKQFTFRANPENAKYLTEMGVDIVSLANNHAYDYGEISLLDSMDTLTAMEMPYVGAGRNIEEASRPFFYETDGLKIGFISSTQIERLDNPDTKGATADSAGVFRSWDGTLLYERVEEAAEQCDFLVVYVHWGAESTIELDWAQKDQAKRLAEAGADLVIGDHSHCLQSIEMIDGVPVFYSVGNFLFNSKTLDTCLVKATIKDGELSSLQFVPALQSGCATKLLTGSEKARVISYMKEISPGLVMDDDGYIQLN